MTYLKPLACEGCPHYGWESFMAFPQPLGRYRVLLVGEALGETEAEEGRPFAGRAGFLLKKLIRHAGLDPEGFGIANAVWCRPPQNKLRGMPYEASAVYQCGQRHLLPLLRRENAPVVVPLGAIPLRSLTGWEDILERRGYVWRDVTMPGGGLLYPTVHPSFVMRGNGNYGTVLIHDLQQAVEYAAGGFIPAPTNYLLDPPPADALRWADAYRAALANDPSLLCAFDIETAYDDEEKEEGGMDDEDRSYLILRISFSYRAGEAISFPWSGEYLAAVRRIFDSTGGKVVWNEGFDVPRLRAAGIQIAGTIFDGMVAWHVLESDLPKRLKFVASMLLPHQGPWKHLNRERPAFYNATDSDVEGQATSTIFQRLRESGLWRVYDRHILQMGPIFVHMSARGMPIDAVRRRDYAHLLASKQSEVLGRMVAAVPRAARLVDHVFPPHRRPQDASECLVESLPIPVVKCPQCGTERPTKAHFRVLKKKVNPCGGLAPITVTEARECWVRLKPWRPSGLQMLMYCKVAGIKPISRRDRQTGLVRPTFDENAIRNLCLRHPEDPLFSVILEYREVDKIAGTYIGRPAASGTGTDGLPSDVEQ